MYVFMLLTCFHVAQTCMYLRELERFARRARRSGLRNTRGMEHDVQAVKGTAPN